MPIEPRTVDEIESDLEDDVIGVAGSVTNVVATSFNRTFLSAFAEQLHLLEVKLLATQLNGWADYAGGPITVEDLDELGIEYDNVEQLNQFIEDDPLDQLGRVFGIERDPGTKATGEVRIETVSDTTTVPEGMAVGSRIDGSSGFYVYRVDADADGEIDEQSNASVTPDTGENFVTVPVIAEERGTAYNTGSIEYLIDPPAGIVDVTIASAVDGGTDEETNDEYRSRLTDAIFDTATGGTSDGIKEYIRDNTESDIDEISLDKERPQGGPSSVDVIVVGGDDEDVAAAVEESRPVGVRHTFVRPTIYRMGMRIEVEGTAVDEETVSDNVASYLDEISFDDDYYRDQIVQAILNADDGIERILSINPFIRSVSGERITYDGATEYDVRFTDFGSIDAEYEYDPARFVYKLDAWPADPSTITVEMAFDDGSTSTLSQGADYNVVEQDDEPESAIEFTSVQTSGTADAESFSVSYNTLSNTTKTWAYQSGQTVYEFDQWPVSPSGVYVENENGTTYEPGTDFEIVDSNGDGYLNAIDFDVGGDSPNPGQDVTATAYIRGGTIDEIESAINDDEVVLDKTTPNGNRVGDYDDNDSGGGSEPDGFTFSGGNRTPDSSATMSVTYYTNTSISGDMTVPPFALVEADDAFVRTNAFESE